MEANNEATGAEVDELIERLSPNPTIQDPSRRRTEIYIREKDFEEHFKLRENVDDNLTTIEKLQRGRYEQTSDNTTKEMVNELIAANAATQATMSAMAAENAGIKTLLTQLLQLQSRQTEQTAKQNEQTETETETETETTNKLPNEQTAKQQNDFTTEMEHMGVLPNSDDTVMYSHDMPVTALFTELENLNPLEHTDYTQHCDTDQRRTVDPFSLYLYFTAHDQGRVIERIENLFKQKSSANAYKAHAKTLIEEISNFSNPRQHTRVMIFLRALIFSSDETTQRTTANVVKAYMATENADLKDLQGHINRHGSPPCVQHTESMITIGKSPGVGRLCAINNPRYYENCVENLFHMVIECNSRINVQGLDTVTAELEYRKTKPGSNFAETKTNEERAWAQLCRVHGNDKPKTDYNRIEFLLALCEQYQGHSTTKRVLLKELHRKGTCLTNTLFKMAVPIMETAAKFEDELNAQMGTGKLPTATVNTVGADAKREGRKEKVGARKGPETCKICENPGHNARDCLQFMLR